MLIRTLPNFFGFQTLLNFVIVMCAIYQYALVDKWFHICRFTQATSDVGEKSVIIGRWNWAAIEPLQRTVDEEHDKIAILHGGGHMPVLARRLTDGFDFFHSGVQWVTTWSITSRNITRSSLLFLMYMQRL